MNLSGVSHIHPGGSCTARNAAGVYHSLLAHGNEILFCLPGEETWQFGTMNVYEIPNDEEGAGGLLF